MGERTAEAQSHVDGNLVAMMIMDFHRTFADTYPDHVMTSSLCAVGPLQSMLGLAIQNGYLVVAKPEESPHARAR